jgi:hypothetical protein
MFFWRVDLVTVDAPLIVPGVNGMDANQITLSQGLNELNSAYLLSLGVARIGNLISINNELVRSIAEGSSEPLSLFSTPLSFKQGEKELNFPGDLTCIATEGGILVLPLRQVPRGPVLMSIDTEMSGENWTIQTLKQRLIPSVPCWLSPRSCPSVDLVVPPVLALNEKARFNSPLIEAFTIRGFSSRENWGIWSVGPTAVFRAQLLPKEGKLDYILTVTLSGFPSRLSRGIQPVELFANDLHIAKWFVSSEIKEYTATIPSSAFSKGDVLALRFEMEAPTRPIDMGMSTDIRKLGIGFHSIKIANENNTKAPYAL